MVLFIVIGHLKIEIVTLSMWNWIKFNFIALIKFAFEISAYQRDALISHQLALHSIHCSYLKIIDKKRVMRLVQRLCSHLIRPTLTLFEYGLCSLCHPIVFMITFRFKICMYVGGFDLIGKTFRSSAIFMLRKH